MQSLLSLGQTFSNVAFAILFHMSLGQQINDHVQAETIDDVSHFLLLRHRHAEPRGPLPVHAKHQVEGWWFESVSQISEVIEGSTKCRLFPVIGADSH